MNSNTSKTRSLFVFEFFCAADFSEKILVKRSALKLIPKVYVPFGFSESSQRSFKLFPGLTGRVAVRWQEAASPSVSVLFAAPAALRLRSAWRSETRTAASHSPAHWISVWQGTSAVSTSAWTPSLLDWTMLVACCSFALG